MPLAALALAICVAHAPRVDCVHDGDTWWQAGEKFRLADVDAPELPGRCPSETALAIRARDRLAQLLGAGYRLRRVGADRYGRTLAIAVTATGSAGDILVIEGLARRWTGRREPWCPA